MNDFTSGYYPLPGIHERMQNVVSYFRQHYLTDALIAEKVTLYASLVALFQTQAPDKQYNTEYPGVNEPISRLDSKANPNVYGKLVQT